MNPSIPEFVAFIPFLPPSVNRAYTVARNRKILSSAAKEFKMRCFEELKGSGLPDFREGDAVRVIYTFFLKNLQNKGWPKKAKHRFKKRDASNWIKLTEDTLSTYVNLDDSAFVGGSWDKKDAKESQCGEGVLIEMYKVEV